MARDLYEVLGVPRNASEAEIKRAFRELTKRHHPDRNPGDPNAEARFREIRDAYEILSNPQKREAYDRYGEAVFQTGTSGAQPGGMDPFEDFFGGFGGLGDIFEGVFGSRRSRGPNGGRRGEDLRYDLEIDLTDVAKGAERQVRYERHAACEPCSGTGCAPGTRPEVCPQCRGTGQMRTSQGFFTLSRPCNRCGATGQIIRVPCDKCHGTGRTQREEVLAITIPVGAETGMQLRVRGKGEMGYNGGAPGDLYVFIHVREHPLFQRRGDDLICEVPIGFPLAALGGELEVPTLVGSERVHVPAGTQSGDVIVLRGRGLPNFHGRGTGDQLVQLRIETPRKLSARQKELLREFAELSGDQTHPQQKSFLDKVKEVLGVGGSS